MNSDIEIYRSSLSKVISRAAWSLHAIQYSGRWYWKRKAIFFHVENYFNLYFSLGPLPGCKSQIGMVSKEIYSGSIRGLSNAHMIRMAFHSYFLMAWAWGQQSTKIQQKKITLKRIFWILKLLPLKKLSWI